MKGYNILYLVNNNMIRINMFITILLITNIYCSDGIQIETNTIEKQYSDIKVLLVADDSYGSSFVVSDKNAKSIKQQFEEFGWNITLAGIVDTLTPCDWSSKTFGTDIMIVDKKISDIINPTEFAAIIILPGRSFDNLLKSMEMMNLLKQANQEGIIIAAWCRGVRVLAAADIIRGKNIIGHFDYFEEYKAAGAKYVDYSFKWDNGKKIFQNVTPPIRDGNIITTVRSLYYRNEMCQLINEAIKDNFIGD